jgi:hypothetical protein
MVELMLGRLAGEKSTRKGVIFTVWVEFFSRMRIRLSLLDKNGQAISQKSRLLISLKSIVRDVAVFTRITTGLARLARLDTFS